MATSDSASVSIAFISTFGGIAVAYIVNVMSKRRRAAAPKDRMENIFDGYEGLIKRQDEALAYKDQQLKRNQELLDNMQRQIDKMSLLVESQRQELDQERAINRDLHDQLDSLRRQYGIDKKAATSSTK
jgi:Skp family chaperone for outer membrane proteins